MTKDKDHRHGKDSAAQKHCVIVLGMHRSGTSALTGALSLAGFDLGRDILPGDPSNPRGHFENEHIVRLNIRALSSLGVTWQDSFLAPPGELSDETLMARFLPELRALLEREFSFSRPLLIKDPRLCLLLPLYRRCLDEMDVQQAFVILTRDPREVIDSLARRNNLSPLRSELLWAYHVLASERFTRGTRRVFLAHEEFIAKPVHEIRKILHALPFTLTEADDLDARIRAFVEPGLANSGERIPPPLTDLSVEALYQLVKDSSGEERAELPLGMDQIADHLARTKYFTIPLNEEYRAEFMLIFSGGSVLREKVSVSRGIFIFSLQPDSDSEISFARLIPCNIDCVVHLKDAWYEKDGARFGLLPKVFSSAVVRSGDRFLFNRIPQYIGVKIGAAGVTRVGFEVSYEIIGERSSKQFVKSYLRGSVTGVRENTGIQAARGPRSGLVQLLRQPLQFVQRIFKAR